MINLLAKCLTRLVKVFFKVLFYLIEAETKCTFCHNFRFGGLQGRKTKGQELEFEIGFNMSYYMFSEDCSERKYSYISMLKLSRLQERETNQAYY